MSAVKELEEFEDCMLDMIQRIEFKTNHHPNKLQTKLGKDVKEIRKDKHIFVKADKTTNHYKTEAKNYNTLLNRNVTKTYKKADPNTRDTITIKDKQIAENLDIDDRIDVSAQSNPFITMKDHKPDFNTTQPAG